MASAGAEPSLEGPPEGAGEVSPPLGSRWLHVLVALVLSPAFAVKVKGYDIWWHMATGRWILEHRRIPTTDPFAYTMEGKPWRLVNAISDVLLYGIYRAGHESGLVVAKVVFAFVLLALLGLALRALRVSRLANVSVVVLAALLVHGRFTEERPMILGACLLVAGELAMIRDRGFGGVGPAAGFYPTRAGARPHRGERRGRSHLFFLLALPLWPLVHATALLGLVELGSLLVASIAARAPRPYVLSVARTLAACLVLSAVLPWWRDTYHVALSLGGSTATTFTAEWSSALESLPYRVGHWMAIAGGILGGLAVARRDASLLLLALAGAAISSRYGRNAYEGVLLAAPGLAVFLDAIAARLRAAGMEVFAGVAAPVTALAIGSVQLALAPLATIGGPFGLGVVRGLFPYDTLQTLRRLPVHRLLNGFAIGGFLIWENGPWGVYCDGRTVALYGEDDVQRLFVPLMESAESVTRASDRWNAPYGLVEHMSPPHQWMMVSPEWVPVHIGLGTSLFIRRGRLGELPPEVRPLPLVRYAADAKWVAGYYRGILEAPALRAELETELVSAARLGPRSPILVEIVRAVQALDAPFGDELADIVNRARETSP